MKIGCFQSLKLGDFICVTPALQLLRQTHPEVEISFIARPALLSVIRRYGAYLDRIYLFPGSPHIPEQRAHQRLTNAFAKKMRQKRFDVLFNFHGAGPQSTNLLHEWHPEKLVTCGEFADNALPVIEKHARMVQMHSDHKQTVGNPSFPLYRRDLANTLAIRQNLHISSDEYVCIHPGASTVTKRWPIEFFASVGRSLRNAGAKIIITGNKAETDLARTLRTKIGCGAEEIASLDLGVGAIAALIASSKLLLCNDTGVLHLAAALQIPSVTIFQSRELKKKWHSTYGSIHAAYVTNETSCLDHVTSASLMRWHTTRRNSLARQEMQ